MKHADMENLIRDLFNTNSESTFNLVEISLSNGEMYAATGISEEFDFSYQALAISTTDAQLVFINPETICSVIPKQVIFDKD